MTSPGEKLAGELWYNCKIPGFSFVSCDPLILGFLSWKTRVEWNDLQASLHLWDRMHTTCFRMWDSSTSRSETSSIFKKFSKIDERPQLLGIMNSRFKNQLSIARSLTSQFMNCEGDGLTTSRLQNGQVSSMLTLAVAFKLFRSLNSISACSVLGNDLELHG